jgi:endo-beta-N-acetylglucosaminidase D
MRDTLPRRPWKNERGIVNLDTNQGPGTHWVAYRKHGSNVEYYDSMGNLRPSRQVVDYFRGNKITYNYDAHQNYNTYNCGHLCLNFVYK